jgi:hypothetical protein
LSPEGALGEADIVVGYGRSVLEGMSAGCAAYVLEHSADGWVTPATYPALEADGFAGSAFDRVVDVDALAGDLAGYEPGMAVAARELVAKHHSPFDHANQLALVLKGLAPRVPPADPLTRELTRLVRLNWEATLRAAEHRQETFALLDRALAAERRALEAEGRLGEIKASRRYRLARALAGPFELARRRRNGRPPR